MKVVILMRTDLKMSVGKIAAQAGHAAVDADQYFTKYSENHSLWHRQGQPIIVLKIGSEAELLKLVNKVFEIHPYCSGTIVDAGKTVFKKKTTTCGWIGPLEDECIDSITGHLKLL